jgi:predicted nucleotide-binding protein
MAKRRLTPRDEVQLRLLVPLDDAREKLAVRIERGVALREAVIKSRAQLEQAEADFSKWNDYNRELLRQLFTSDEIANEYSHSLTGPFVVFQPDLGRDIREFRETLHGKVTRLESIAERLELIPLADEITERVEAPVAASVSGGVFIVHGHDEALREKVARFLEQLGLDAVILHEKASEGATVIEKLERYANVGFAVVLLTPDDIGRSQKEDILRPRARQNVILELGYFTGKLGRKRVCALHRGGIELPSDYLGVAFVPVDEGDGWKLRLAKELKAVGFDIDMNRAI